jgi:hypothetical protein
VPQPIPFSIPRTVEVHLYASRDAKLAVTFEHPYEVCEGRPRVVIWQRTAYLQELSNADSPNYYATGTRWVG